MKTFVVLGMHRSATSLIAKGLSGNIDMGAEYIPYPDNPKGNWEDQKIVMLNISILKAAGGSWDNPPLEEDILRVWDQFDAEIKDVVEKRNHLNRLSQMWGWKDPRTVLTIKLFMPYLENPHFICCFRNPVEVAASLHRRNGFDMTRGINLALEYNNRIVRFLQSHYCREVAYVGA